MSEMLTFRSLELHFLLTVTGQGVLLCKALDEQFCHSPGSRKGMHRLSQFFRLGDFLCHALRHRVAKHPKLICLFQP